MKEHQLPGVGKLAAGVGIAIALATGAQPVESGGRISRAPQSSSQFSCDYSAPGTHTVPLTPTGEVLIFVRNGTISTSIINDPMTGEPFSAPDPQFVTAPNLSTEVELAVFGNRRTTESFDVTLTREGVICSGEQEVNPGLSHQALRADETILLNSVRKELIARGIPYGANVVEFAAAQLMPLSAQDRCMLKALEDVPPSAMTTAKTLDFVASYPYTPTNP